MTPTGDAAEALLTTVYDQTAVASQCSALFFVRASLELQLDRVQDAHQTVATISQNLGDIPPPCWLLHFKTMLHWSKGQIGEVRH